MESPIRTVSFWVGFAGLVLLYITQLANRNLQITSIDAERNTRGGHRLVSVICIREVTKIVASCQLPVPASHLEAPLTAASYKYTSTGSFTRFATEFIRVIGLRTKLET
jgi:hypothetical protein